ncbi:synembryn-B isoform X2 [Erpetoichthys calabaricus]|nr:synembryn-B isoform X2 [Erpetoichthys calabaricus]
MKYLEIDVQSSCRRVCLETLRILSRDKKVLEPVTTKQGMLVLIRLARLEVFGESVLPIEEVEIVIEALKCLCNIVFNSTAAQQISAEMKLASGLHARLNMYVDQDLSHEVVLFTLRLIFLLSALRNDVRDCLEQELQSVGLLIQILQRILDIKWIGKYAVGFDTKCAILPHDKNECTIEALKVLFNLTLSNNQTEDDVHQFRLITAIMRHLLMIKAQNEDKTEELHSNAINLLSNIPVTCLDVLIDFPTCDQTDEYHEKNMDAIHVLVNFMEKRIDKGENYREGLTPVFSLMTEISRHYREIRKYIKAQVLPPLKDVKNRPEVGTTVRNKLVRLMTHVDTGVKQSAAEFLFVLCKESVDNLLKYTGYGNAAGLLAARGLLAGGRGDGQYSEDEDSDTEEYKSAKPFINPITGHVEEPMPNPLEEMTDEQKEYEALKLVHMFDKLSREEIIKPMGVRRDGTLAPLGEAVRQCALESDTSDSD